MKIVKVPKNSVRDDLQQKNIKHPEIVQEGRAGPKQQKNSKIRDRAAVAGNPDSVQVWFSVARAAESAPCGVCCCFCFCWGTKIRGKL